MPANAIIRWLLSTGRTYTTVGKLQAALVEQLVEHVPVDRLWCGTTVLHPQAAAYLWIWQRDSPPKELELGYAQFSQMEESDSPARRLKHGADHVRFRYPEGNDLPDIADLWREGFGDLYGQSMVFRGAWVGGITWATRAEGGFTSVQLEFLEQLTHALTAVIEPMARDLVTATLLRTYLGKDAGDRVSSGQVRRGDQQTLRAAVWFCDVRGFTQLSATLPRQQLLDLLNDTFEEIVHGLHAHGGQVLKFMGDGLLAVFTGDDEGAACRSAADAVTTVQGRLAELTNRRSSHGLTTADVGVGLHFGDVTYGNIGAPARLDFTVIGSAVNLAARVESLCGRLGVSALGTEAFAFRANAGWTKQGEHSVKGVDEPVEVYQPPQ
jgi:adenylate cyclase